MSAHTSVSLLRHIASAPRCMRSGPKIATVAGIAAVSICIATLALNASGKQHASKAAASAASSYAIPHIGGCGDPEELWQHAHVFYIDL